MNNVITPSRGSEINPEAQQRIRDFIDDAQNAEVLHRTLCLYVNRAKLAKNEEVKEVALEVLAETFTEAMTIADHFDPSRRMMAWLLGIAVNIIHRRRVKRAKIYHHEVAVEDAVVDIHHQSGELSARQSDSQLFDRLTALAVAQNRSLHHTNRGSIPLFQDDVAQEIASNEQVAFLLSTCSPGEKQLITLAVLYELDGNTLAKALSVSPGAARVRLHRALERLRTNLTGEEL